MISIVVRRLRSLGSAVRGQALGGRGFRGHGRGRVAAALVLFSVVATALAVGFASLTTDTTPGSFLPEGDPSIESLNQAASSFGGDPVVVLAESREPRQLLGPDEVTKLITVEGLLSQLPDVAVVYGPGTVVNQIAGSAQDLLATISGQRDAIRGAAEAQARAEGAPAEAAAARGAAALAGFDDRYGALLVRALPAGLPTVRNPGFVDAVTFDPSGATRPQMQFVVPSPNAVAILVRPRGDLDQAGNEALVDRVRETVERGNLTTTRVTVTGGPAVAAGLGGAVEAEVPILGGLALVLIAGCYWLSPWTRSKPRRLLPLAATLGATVLVLAGFGWLSVPLSLGVVAFLPILIGIGDNFPAYVIAGANRRVVAVTAAASAAAFSSLALSPLPFVRDLGFALGAGVLLTMGISMVFRRYLASTDAGDEPPQPAPTVGAAPRPLTLGPRLTALLVAGLVAVLGWTLLPRIDVEARPDQLAAGLPAVADALHAEEILGSSGEVQILLRGQDVRTPEAMAWMRTAQDTAVLRFGNRLHPIVSPPDLLRFLGPSPTREEIDAALELLPEYLSGAVLRADGTQAVVSLGIELQDVNEQKVLLDGLEAALPATPPGTEASVVGLPVAAARGFELVSGDRYLTNAAGILGAGLVLLLGLRRRTDAGRAVLAAAFSTGWSLVLIAVLDIPLSPLTVALGAFATATAAEFTLILAQENGRGFSPVKRTVLVAAATALLGYLTMAASGLAVIRGFGILLAVTVVLSLAASYLVVRLLPPAPVVPDSGPDIAVEDDKGPGPAQRRENVEVMT